MRPPSYKVIARTRSEIITAPLEYDKMGRPFLVLEYWLKGDNELFKDKIELDPNFLQQADRIKHGADFLYKREIEIPKQENN